METLNYDNLLAGDYPAVTDIRTIVSGQDLSRGAVLGKVTASGKYTLCDSTAADGSESPVCILAEDCDASEGDVNAEVFLSGQFNEDQLTYGGTDDADTHRDALRDLNIYLKKAVSA